MKIRFQESGESMARMSPEAEGKDILVPLTGSMYVPGTLVEPEKVIVDVGTGYYVEKDISAAKDYFQRKVKFLFRVNLFTISLCFPISFSLHPTFLSIHFFVTFNLPFHSLFRYNLAFLFTFSLHPTFLSNSLFLGKEPCYPFSYLYPNNI